MHPNFSLSLYRPLSLLHFHFLVLSPCETSYEKTRLVRWSSVQNMCDSYRFSKLNQSIILANDANCETC